MASKKKKVAKSVPFNTADLANITKANPYIQRLIEDAKLRDNVRSAFDASRSAYGRLSNGKAPTKTLLEDKKLQRDLRNAAQSLRDATVALTAPPKKERRRRGVARMVFVLVLGAGVAMVASEKLRSKVLDTLFGAEEEFEYTPPPPPPATGTSPPTTPVSAA